MFLSQAGGTYGKIGTWSELLLVRACHLLFMPFSRWNLNVTIASSGQSYVRQYKQVRKDNEYIMQVPLGVGGTVFAPHAYFTGSGIHSYVASSLHEDAYVGKVKQKHPKPRYRVFDLKPIPVGPQPVEIATSSYHFAVPISQSIKNLYMEEQSGICRMSADSSGTVLWFELPSWADRSVGTIPTCTCDL